MKILTTNNIFIPFLLIFLSFRIWGDFIYIKDKPGIIIAIFTTLSLVLIIYNVAKLINKTDLILFFLALLMIFYPLAFSQQEIIEQLSYNLKILLIPLVILACSHLEISFVILRKYARWVITLVLIVSLIYFFSLFAPTLGELYTKFDNNPIHPVAQTVAKVSLLFLYSKAYLFIGFLSVLILLNVRSNLLPILLIFLHKNIKIYFKYILFLSLLIIAIILILSSIESSSLSIDTILQRFITKNRPATYAGEGVANISSGRFEIWSFYFNYIADNYTLLNYIFGTGSLEIQGKYRLNAHNDFINVIINFGIFGFIVLTLLYYEIYKRISPRYKNIVAFYFIFVFLSNGIMFHQSNILFLLYLQGMDNENLTDNFISQLPTYIKHT